MRHAQTHEVWTRQSERAWLLTLNATQLAGYLVGVTQRRVDFDGKPVTAEFLASCRLDHQRAVERLAAT